MSSTSMSNRKQYFDTPSPLEKQFGFHRAIRKGQFVFVSGTTALKYPGDGNQSGSDGDSNVHFPKDGSKQAKIVMQRCVDALEKVGGKLEDVVRVRMFVTNFDDCSNVGAAFKEAFTRPDNDEVGAVATMIVVGQKGFVDPDILVEVEVDAIIGN